MNELESVIMLLGATAPIVSLFSLASLPFLLVGDAVINKAQGTFLKTLRFNWDIISKVAVRDGNSIYNPTQLKEYISRKKQEGYYFIWLP